mgnify:CR=1 FL=1
MKLAQFRLGFPILKIKARIYHATPRSPTAFERVLLGICERFGKDVTYNNIAIERIFVDILGVADPAPIVVPTIRELLSLDVIRCQGDPESLDTLTLRDLEITERGRQMRSADMLPAKSQENDEEFFYDPVRKRLLTSSETKACRVQRPSIALDEGVFAEVFPEQELRAQILSGGYSWWNVSSRIERIERLTLVVLWREVQSTLNIENKAIHIECKDEKQTSYVNALGADIIQHRFLDPVLGIDRYPPDHLSSLPRLDIENDLGGGVELQPIPEALKDFPNGDPLWIVDSASAWVPLREDAGSKQAIISFNPLDVGESMSVRWNQGRDGCIINVTGAFPIGDALVASGRRVVRGRLLRAKVGHEVLDLPIALSHAVTRENPALADTLRHLANALRQFKADDADIVPALWQSAEDFWKDTGEEIRQSTSAVAAKLDRLVRVRGRCNSLTGAIPLRVWESVVEDVVCDSLASGDSVLSTDALEQIVVSLAKCELSQLDVTNRIAQTLVDKLAPPHSLSDLYQLSILLSKAGRNWHVPYPSRLYTDEVLADIARRFREPKLADILPNDNQFEATVRGLAQRAISIARLVGRQGFPGLDDEAAYVSLLKSPDLTQLAENAESWRREYDAFISASPRIARYVAGSDLGDTNGCIERILSITHRLVGGLDPRFRSVFVIDTSALIERPEIMKSIGPNEFIVVSKRVIEELDDKKREEPLRPRVADATRMLQSFPRQQIHFCDGDMSLLAPDYRMKGDNLILSVAVRYRKHRPVLVTNDKNLALKARAEGIASMSVDDFEKRSRQSVRPEAGGVEKKPSQGPTGRPPRPRRRP